MFPEIEIGSRPSGLFWVLLLRVGMQGVLGIRLKWRGCGAAGQRGSGAAGQRGSGAAEQRNRGATGQRVSGAAEQRGSRVPKQRSRGKMLFSSDSVMGQGEALHGFTCCGL